MTSERFQKIKDILNKRQPDLTVVMDNVHKPHNLAAIIRTCDAIGIGDIHGVSTNEQKVGVNLKSASGSNHWVNLHIHDSTSSIIRTLKKDDDMEGFLHKSISFKYFESSSSNKEIFFKFFSKIDDSIKIYPKIITSSEWKTNVQGGEYLPKILTEIYTNKIPLNK